MSLAGLLGSTILDRMRAGKKKLLAVAKKSTVTIVSLWSAALASQSRAGPSVKQIEVVSAGSRLVVGKQVGMQVGKQVGRGCSSSLSTYLPLLSPLSFYFLRRRQRKRRNLERIKVLSQSIREWNKQRQAHHRVRGQHLTFYIRCWESLSGPVMNCNMGIKASLHVQGSMQGFKHVPQLDL